MANVLTNNPIILDTVMGSDFWTSISVPAGQGKPIIVQKIRWVNPGAAGAGAFTIVEPISGKTLEQGNAPAASLNPDQEIVFPKGKAWRNWQLTAISGGGKLEIHYY
jgi:hypothetical protein